MIQQLPGNDYGTETYTWNVVWDEQGIAYLGRDHLWRWDGQELEEIGTESFLALRGMSMDEEGNIWLAGINQFGVYNPESGIFSSRLHWLPDKYRQFGEAWILYHDGRSIWMGTDKMLFRITEAEVSFWEFRGEHRIIFHFLPSGIYAHETNVGLWRILDEGKVLVSSDKELSRKSVLFLEDREDGGLLALSGNGLFIINEDSGRCIHEWTDLQIDDLKISTATRISEELILVGTLGNGLFLLNVKEELLRNVLESEFQESIILHLDYDSFGRTWILDTTNPKIAKTCYSAGKSVSNIKNTLGIINTVIQADDAVFVSSETGSYCITFQQLYDNTPFRLTSNPCFKIDNILDGLIIDDYDKLYYAENGEVELLHKFSGAISTFTTNGDGIVFVAFSSKLGVYEIDGERNLNFLGVIDSENNLQKLGVDGSGHMWGWSPRAPLVEAWIDGAGELRMARHVEAGGLLLEEYNYRLAVTKSGPVLIFPDQLLWKSNESGDWDQAPLDEINNLTEAYTFSSSGNVLEGWVVNWDSGIDYYKVIHLAWQRNSSFSEEIIPWPDMRELGRITQILPVELPGIRYVVGGSEGILLAGKEVSKQVPVPSKPVIYLGEPMLSSAIPERFNYGTGLIEFNFRSLDNGGQYPIRYQTRLLGEEDWSAPMRLGYRSVGQLAAGNYSFEVRAVDPFGRISPASVVGFTVMPPWYWSPFSWAAYIALSVFCIYGLIHISMRRLRARQEILETLVEERTADLLKAVTFKDELIANLSHEIRNPLNGIIGLIRQMKEGMVPPVNYIKALRGAADYLHATVEEVLNFSKLEAGTVQLVLAPMDIGKISEGVLEIYREQAVTKGLEFSVQTTILHGKGIVSDSHKIQQIIGNLAGNAVKFTEEGSVTVVLSLRQTEGKQGILDLSIKDTGPGILPVDQERIFEKFVRIEQEGLRKSGTGIGLALVKSYADQMGASLELESKEGSGSTFRLKMPVELCPIEGQQETPEDGIVSEVPLRILVVEDVDYNRMVMEDLLVGFGCRVESAGDGRKGLEMAMERPYDVIILDWELPGMNGLEIACSLRSSGCLSPHTRIFALTAYATPEIEHQCMEAGMDSFLTKPVDEVRIRKLLEKKTAVAGEGGMTKLAGNTSSGSSVSLIIGRGKLGEMMGGDWPAACRRFDGFWEEYLAELTCSMNSGDPERIRQSAHKFLGFIQMIDLRVLPDCLRVIQDAAKAGDLEEVGRQWNIFAGLLSQFLEEWNQVKAG